MPTSWQNHCWHHHNWHVCIACWPHCCFKIPCSSSLPSRCRPAPPPSSDCSTCPPLSASSANSDGEKKFLQNRLLYCIIPLFCWYIFVFHILIRRLFCYFIRRIFEKPILPCRSGAGTYTGYTTHDFDVLLLTQNTFLHLTHTGALLVNF